MVSSQRMAVLLTCHNRVDRTLRCLDSLFDQDPNPASVEVVLVDAGSEDGTSDEVARRYPQVDVVRRGPELFWNGGMRVALAHAYQTDPDYYLWLNDDVVLDQNALATLLVTAKHVLATDATVPSIIVGSTRDPETGMLSYGGVRRSSRARPLRYALVAPASEPRRVETMNGNCVLVPSAVVARIGNLAAAYTHGMGDYDYGHRANLAGCEVWIAPGFVGTCARNSPRERANSLAEHRQRAIGPTTGLPPSEWFTFARRWAGPVWPFFALSPYVRRLVRWALRKS